MRDNKAPETHGESGTSKLKKERREMEKDRDWKGEELKDAERRAKQGRRPGAAPEEKTTGLVDKRP